MSLSLALRAARLAPRTLPARLSSSVGFTKDHEWIRIEGKTGTIGITDFAQNALGEVVFVDLPEVGKVVAKGKTVAAVESVKAASDIYAPVSGQITEVNEKLRKEPQLLNQSAQKDGWIAKIAISKPEETSTLLTEAAYQKLIA
eukprot:TRINITY_DN15575_c0_g1_i1.p1 TRINITY_DN15575_c0_g1~~TRINITY_DN15575_c0_g1_i1.p1  ORF type:complete len:166 (+),score=65.11 TRINITY_DN15575_c0_g1_i1:68-499(+)